MMNKKGAIDWTIGKLINIVLLTVVMALILFGLTTGGLNPLIENVEGKFDEVLIMFNFKDDVSFDACFSANVTSVGGGEVFLKNVGLEGEAVGLNVCRNRMCNFTGGLEEYRNAEGVFEKSVNGEWGNPLVFSGDLASVRFNWELHGKVSDILKSAEGVDFLVNPEPTKKFVLHGDGSGAFSYPMTATWQNNVWMIEHGDNPTVFIEDDNAAIDVFVNKVWGGNDDKVSYDDGMGKSGEIGDIVGRGWFVFRSYGELDSDEEVTKLKAAFAEKKIEYLKLSHPLKEEIESLRNVMEGSEIIVGEEEFNVEVKDIDGEIVIVLVSEELRLGMKYKLRGGYNDAFGCGRSSLPLVLVEWVGSWKEKGNEDYYKLNEACFENVYHTSLIDHFLTSKCR